MSDNLLVRLACYLDSHYCTPVGPREQAPNREMTQVSPSPVPSPVPQNTNPIPAPIHVASIPLSDAARPGQGRIAEASFDYQNGTVSFNVRGMELSADDDINVSVPNGISISEISRSGNSVTVTLVYSSLVAGRSERPIEIRRNDQIIASGTVRYVIPRQEAQAVPDSN